MEKINLTGVPETMLQTIYARAKESRTRGAVHDGMAEKIIDRLDYDFSLATEINFEKHRKCEVGQAGNRA